MTVGTKRDLLFITTKMIKPRKRRWDRAKKKQRKQKIDVNMMKFNQQ